MLCLLGRRINRTIGLVSCRAGRLPSPISNPLSFRLLLVSFTLFIDCFDIYKIAVHVTDGRDCPSLMAGSAGSKGTAGSPAPLGRSQVVESARKIAWVSIGGVRQGRPLVRCQILPNLAETGSWSPQTFSRTLYISPILVQCWSSVADAGLTLKQRWVSVSLE